MEWWGWGSLRNSSKNIFKYGMGKGKLMNFDKKVWAYLRTCNDFLIIDSVLYFDTSTFYTSKEFIYFCSIKTIRP